MKLGRSACLAGIVALGALSLAACSSDKNNGGNDGGPDGGGATPSTGGKTGTGGSGGTSSGGSAGKSTGGSAGSTGGSGTGGESTDSGTGPSIIDAGFDGGAPSVKITNPADLANVGAGDTYPNFPKIAVSFKVGNFELAAPGTPKATCPLGTCGHVHVNIDGSDCDQSAVIKYNNAGNTSPIDIDLSLCKAGVPGAHTVVISLHNTDHSNVDVGGTLVTDTITINALATDAGTSDAGKKDSGS